MGQRTIGPQCFPGAALSVALWAGFIPHAARADGERWNAPFGGTFSANFTVASDYAFAGISQTKREPAFQMGLDYKTAEVSAEVPLWLYVTAWGSNIDLSPTGPGVEIDLSGGLKFRAFDRKLSADFGYIRYLYPDVPASLAYASWLTAFQAATTGIGRWAWSRQLTDSTSRSPTPTPASNRPAAATPTIARVAYC